MVGWVYVLRSSWIFLFCKRRPLFDALSNVYQTDVWSVRYTYLLAWNRINSVGSLFFRDRVLRFGKNMPPSLKKFLSNFNVAWIWKRSSQFKVVAIQNSLVGFRNTLNVGNNSKTCSLSSGVLLVVTGFRQLRRKVLVQPFAFYGLWIVTSRFSKQE